MDRRPRPPGVAASKRLTAKTVASPARGEGRPGRRRETPWEVIAALTPQFLVLLTYPDERSLEVRLDGEQGSDLLRC
jgi:hypothetical protein